MHILYLHGLGSNGRSSTAANLASKPNVSVAAPTYQPEHFLKSVEELSDIVRRETPDVIAGTSMGGYYALKLREAFNIPTLAVNPCFDPVTHLRKYLTTPAMNYETGEPIVFTVDMVQAFEILERQPPRPDRMVLIGLNDDVIHPDGQKAFCEGYGWAYKTVDWGHRVDDVDLLLSQILNTCNP